MRAILHISVVRGTVTHLKIFSFLSFASHDHLLDL